jgi:prepilin-type N-terminal cleavage/methylation domain-containing protein
MIRRWENSQAGFTLIEILVAMLVFLSGVAGIYALLSTGLSMQQDGLAMSRAGRRLEAVVHVLSQELAEGALTGDVPAAQLADGTWFRMTDLSEAASGSQGARLVEIRVAGTERGLDHSPPFTYLLGPGPSMTQAVETWRSRRAAGTTSRSPATLEAR